MSIIEITSLVLLFLFGVAFIGKLIILAKKNNIKANVFGKGSKPKEVLNLEKALKAVTFIGLGIWVISVVFPEFTNRWFIGLPKDIGSAIFGLAITFIGVLFFIMAMAFMKTSWRAGIDKSTKTSLVTSGIYRFSRNPAFVGLDFIFIGTAITHANLLMIIASTAILFGYHLQILQEEKHLAEAFGGEYIQYAKKTPRYLLF